MASSLPSKTSKLNAGARLRFAPSPTGNLHIGGLRTALYNHLLARKWGGKWILRIEDTDQERKMPGAVDSLRRSLEWAGLDYDEGPGAGSRGEWSYVQSERLDLYRFHVQQLLDSGQAYRCFCTPTELARIKEDLRKRGSNNTYDRTALRLTDEEVARKMKAGEKYVVRFKSCPGPIPFSDLVMGGTEAMPSAPLDDMVLLKSDGFPTYHLANVVDDHEMGITHVLRGEEWRTSVNKHLQLYKAFGWERPEFAHLPLLVNPDGSKLSKRHGAVSVEDFRSKGYEPSALLNFVGLMGWAGPQASAAASHDHAAPRDHADAPPFLPSSADSEPHRSLDYKAVQDCLTVEQMTEKIEVSQIMNRSQQVFLPNLDWLQKLHVNRRWESSASERLAMVKEVKKVLVKQFPDSPRAADEPYLDRILDSERVRLMFPRDIALSPFLFTDHISLSTPEALSLSSKIPISQYLSTLSTLLPILRSLPEETFLHSEKLQTAVSEGMNPVKGGKLWTPVRHALTGMKTGPGVAVTMGLLGREETVRRMEAAVREAEKKGGA